MSLDSQNESILPPAGQTGREEGVDLFAITVALLVEWRIGLITFVIAAVLSVLFIWSLKPQYVASATLLPQEGHTQTDSIAALFSNRGPGALYIGLLKSRSVQDSTIDHAHLLQHFHTNSYESARKVLASKSSFTEGIDTIIEISVRDTNAQNAALIANAYLEALQDLDDKMGLAQTVQTRHFFERQLEQEKDELAQAEDNLEKTQKQTGLIAPETQTSIGLNAIAATRNQITNLQVQLASLLQSETEQNPQVVRLRSQLSQLQQQEAELERGGASPVGAAPPAGQLPQTNLDFIRAQREVKYHDALVTSLASQFETARLNEDFARSAFRVIDPAVPPEQKAWPPRKPFFIFGIFFSAFLGLLVIIAKLVVKRIASDPSHRANIKVLRSAFSGK